MQAIIRQKLEVGETPDQIEAFFLASYGDFILLKPRARGLSALVYILPVAGFLLAFMTIALRMRRGNGSRGVVVVEAVAGNASASTPARTESDLPPEDRKWLDAAIHGDS
jgi:cytochrome c-type biogenesis protein CcmH/NrfF